MSKDVICRGRLKHALNGIRAGFWAALVAITKRLPRVDADRWERLAEARAPRCGGVIPRRAAGGWRKLDLRDNLERTVYLTGTYDTPLQELLRTELRPGDVFADIGANIGIIAHAAARAVGPHGMVHCFEAADDVAREFHRVLGTAPNVRLHTGALGRETGTALLRSNSTWGAADRGVRSLYGDGEGTTVAIETFDAWARRERLERLDVVKVDVEGAEMDVLLGMTSTLSTLRPRLLILELIDEYLARSGASTVDVIDLLAGLGYIATPERRGANATFRPAH